ncbi:MAG: HDIG domain-containing metalloprotein [Thermodesulfobacteriota bacterium]
MVGEKENKVSRLFLGLQRRKAAGVRSAAKKKKRRFEPWAPRLALLGVLSILTVFIAFPMPDSLQLEEIADRDVKADRDLMVMDPVATEEKRQAARRNSPLVFDLDDLAAQGVQEQVHRLFARGRNVMGAPASAGRIFMPTEPREKPREAELEDLRTAFNSAFNLPAEDGAFDALAEIEFSARAERAVFQLVMDLLNQGVVTEKSVLIEAQDKGIVVRRVSSKTEDLVLYPANFPSLEEARHMVRARAMLLSGDFKRPQVQAIVTLAHALLRPTLILNQPETETRRETAVAAVAPVYFQVKKGEIIVREAERVDTLAREKLRALASKADRRDWLPRAAGFLVLALIFVGVTYLVAVHVSRDLRLFDRDLLFLGVVLIVILVMNYVANQIGDAMAHGFPGVSKATILFTTPVAAGGMLTTIFLGPMSGLFFSIVASALTGLVFDRSLHFFFYFFLGSVAGLSGVVHLRQRGAVVRSGLVVSLVNLGAILAFGLMQKIPLDRGVLFLAASAVSNGLLVGITVTGLLPLFEMTFRYTTNVKLLELANLDSPVLRELMVQAPGTYHHSVIVGAMVEASAEAIGANPLLAKVSAYYHDLGKMKKPLYFVENQSSGVNKHEKLAPSMSSLILISHVKDGVELARRHKLSQEIIDIVQQHHGTSLIAYFYQKAKDKWVPDQPEINIEDFRYPGPKPQTREAGLVMLADAVEAASRSLTEPTPSRVQGLVQKLINNIFSDGQLDECELTLKDLHLIARSFNKILTGIFHRRIEYPEPAVKEVAARAKAANGSQSKQPPKDSPDQDGQAKGKSKEDLKRLGLT